MLTYSYRTLMRACRGQHHQWVAVVALLARRSARLALLSAALTVSTRSPAQTRPVPVRTLTVDATGAEEFTMVSSVRELPNGSVLVVDVSEKRVTMLDRTLQHAKPVGRTGRGPGEYLTPMTLLAAPGDSTWLTDIANQRLLILDPMGRPTGVKLLGATGMRLELQSFFTGTPVVGAHGRIVYQGTNISVSPAMQMATTPTAPLLRRDLAKNTVDTLTSVQVSAPRMKMSGDFAKPGTVSMEVTVDPFPVIDDWALLVDGTLAVIRGSDNHIDWTRADGRKWSTAPIPFVRVPVTAAEKKVVLASLAKTDSMMRARMAGMGGGVSLPKVTQGAPDHWPEFKPPFSARFARASPDGNLWIISATAGEGKWFYDVIDQRGRIVEHVRLPAGRMLVGFGRRSVYLLQKNADDIYRLERASLK